MSSKIQTYAELQKMIRKALGEQHPEWIGADGKCTLCDVYEARFAELRVVFALARRSPGEGLSAPKPYDVGPNFTRTQFSTLPGRGTQTDEQHECRTQRDESSCVWQPPRCQNFVPKEISRHMKCRSSNA
jgi:hypothetical protein